MLYVLIVIFNSWSFAAEKTPTKTKAPVVQTAPEAAKPGPQSFNADVYDLEGKEKMFTFESERLVDGTKLTYTARFKDLSGAVVAEEKAEVDNFKIIRFEASRTTGKDKGLVEGRNGKLFFDYTEGVSKKGRKWENEKPNTLIGATMVPYIEKHFAELMAKKDVSFSYAVWYRQETIGFKFFYDKEEGENVVFQMVPTNLFYRSLVNPLFFTLNKNTKKLISIKGRTLPKVKKDNAWRDFDALIKYH